MKEQSSTYTKTTFALFYNLNLRSYGQLFVLVFSIFWTHEYVFSFNFSLFYKVFVHGDSIKSCVVGIVVPDIKYVQVRDR